MTFESVSKCKIFVIFSIIICAGEVLVNGNVSVKNNLVLKDYDPDEKSVEDVGKFSRPVVPKCCNLTFGFSFENKSCVETEDDFLPEFEDDPEYVNIAKNMSLSDRYDYYIGDPCSDEKYILDHTYDNYSIYSNGTLLYFEKLYSKEEYCLESVDGSIRVFKCFGESLEDVEFSYIFIIYSVGLLISIPFLLATAVVYLCVDMFRDLRGKALACHVLCLALGYFFLALVQLGTDELNELICVGAGFAIQFFFVAAFFWLNIICYNTWRCINNDFRCGTKLTNPRSEKVTFCYYCLYGWYGPCLLTIPSLVMDLAPAIPNSYLKPNFGFRSCWFYSHDAALPYFYGPVGVLILINIIFFLLSARKIYLEQRKRVKVMIQNSNHENETREKSLSIRIYTKTLQECIYLFGIMGINWTAEVISWAVGGSKAIWIITDVFNTLQGIVIFYLFVLRPIKVRNEVKLKFHKTWKKVKKCDCRREAGSKRVSRHWHADITEEPEETTLALQSLIPSPTHV